MKIENHMADQSNGVNPKPKAIEEIASSIGCMAFIPFVCGILYFVGFLIQPNGLQTDLLAPFIVMLAILSLGAFQLVLATEFSRLKPWTYRWVYWQVATWWGWNWSRMSDFPDKIKSPEVRRAFGLDDSQYNPEKITRN